MKRYLAEFIGTFALVFCGTTAIIINDLTGGTITHVGISFTFGLVVIAMIYSFGEISGAHINPAVTFAFWLSGRFKGKDVLPYIGSQFSGALAASFMAMLLFPHHPDYGATMPAFSVSQTFFLEIILSFFLMLVIINVSTGSKETGIMAGFAIGGTVLLEAMFAGPVSGASMNPARSFGPAIISGQVHYLWIYFVAPLIGASIAIFACIGVKEKECCPLPFSNCK